MCCVLELLQAFVWPKCKFLSICGISSFGGPAGGCLDIWETQRKGRQAQAMWQFFTVGTATPTKPKQLNFHKDQLITQNISMFIVSQRPEWRVLCLINHV